MKKAGPRPVLTHGNASHFAALPEPSPVAGPNLFSIQFIRFSTATDTRSNAPARRDEDRVIRPLVCCRRCRDRSLPLSMREVARHLPPGLPGEGSLLAQLAPQEPEGVPALLVKTPSVSFADSSLKEGAWAIPI
ncbi:MAG: hypothetical protein IKH11_07255 [Bacteroidales bacterium]|nr:hypothetical protein [Bacteroidales bacterium]